MQCDRAARARRITTAPRVATRRLEGECILEGTKEDGKRTKRNDTSRRDRNSETKKSVFKNGAA